MWSVEGNETRVRKVGWSKSMSKETLISGPKQELTVAFPSLAVVLALEEVERQEVVD